MAAPAPIPAVDPAPPPAPAPAAPALPDSIKLDRHHAFFLDGAFVERSAGETITDAKEIAYFVGRVI